MHKVLPNANIVANRFHLMKLVNQELNVVRNAVIKAAKDHQNESEKLRVNAALNHSKYALLKPEEQLTQKQ